MSLPTFKIRSTEERDDEDIRLFWNNEEGWVDYDNADTFTQQERYFLDLPLGGYWYLIDR